MADDVERLMDKAKAVVRAVESRDSLREMIDELREDGGAVLLTFGKDGGLCICWYHPSETMTYTQRLGVLAAATAVTSARYMETD